MAEWTVIIPFFNEAEFLPATIASLGAQTRRPDRLLLVDNTSTDGSAEVARAAAAAAGLAATHLHEARPGKIHALETAMAHLATPLVALTDADTVYPPHYLALAARLLARPGTVAAMAVGLPSDPESAAARRHRWWRGRVMPALLPRQTHTGGYGQSFRSDALIAAGGFSEAQWPYVLLDHEIMQRVLKQGRAVYHPDLWCITSDRRADRSRVRWTLAERLLYHATPFALKDWYFYRFLGPRLAQRRLTHLNLREKSWVSADPG